MSLIDNLFTGLKILALNVIGLLVVGIVVAVFNFQTTDNNMLSVAAVIYITTVITLQGMLATRLYNWK